MIDLYTEAQGWLENYPYLYTLLALCLLIIAAWLANWVVKKVLIRGLLRLIRATPLAAVLQKCASPTSFRG